jgi:transcriptional regulator with XRE-family HTH domain
MAYKRWSQKELARRAKVSQPTVSRALNRQARRHGIALSKLFSYAKIDEWTAPQSTPDIHVQVVAAFDRIWDRSPDHAAAIVKVIDALADLRPAAHPDEREK